MPKIFADEYDKKIYSFRRWFKGKRNLADITLTDLGRKMGVSHAAVSRKLQTKGDGQSEITYRDLLLFFKETKASDAEILHYMKMED